MCAQALVISSANTELKKKNVLHIMSAQAVVISSAHAGFIFYVLRVMSAQAVVISSAHAGFFFQYILCYVCTGSSNFFCTCRIFF
jgi:hypothetical protein